MCARCWGNVSSATQQEVYRTVSLRGKSVDRTWAAWWRAQARACAEVEVAHGKMVAEAIQKQVDRADEFATSLEKRA